MFYSFIKFLTSIILRIYFRKIEVKGLDNLPSEGPLLIVANHPNTILDALTIGCSINRQIFILVNAGVFKSPIAKKLLPKFNAIPINRVQDDPNQMKSNDQTFALCYEHLKNNNSILIFPEGVSITDRKLKKIKTGTSRIALGAEAENDFKLGVKIVSIGLNYSDPHKFQSDLFINIDEPILVQDYENQFKADAFKATTHLTEEIRNRLEQQIVAIEDAGIDRVVKNIEIIYKSQLLKDLGYSRKIREHDFIVTKAINEEVHYFFSKQPDRATKIKNNIDAYFRNLDRLELNDNLVKQLPRMGFSLKSTLNLFYIIIGFPFFLFGFINNYIPFKLPVIITRKIVGPDYYGSVSMLLGALTFLMFYGLQLWLMQYYFRNTLLTLGYLFVLPLSGFFAFYYWKRFTTFRGSWTIINLFYRKTDLITSLITMRQNIIEDLEKGRKEYAEMHP